MDLKAGIERYSELILYKTYAELKTEASSYFLGMLWWVLEPALYLLAFYGVFRWGFRQGDDNFVAFLLVALVHWKWFASCIISSANSIISARGLISQIYLPKLVFPAFAIALSTSKFMITAVLMLVILLVMDSLHTQALVWLLPLWLLQAALAFVIGTVVALLVPILKDLRPIIDNGLIVMMLISGIFFDINQMPATVQDYFYLNPVAALFDQYRQVLLYGLAPTPDRLYSVVAFIAVFTGAAVVCHRLLNRVIPKVMI